MGARVLHYLADWYMIARVHGSLSRAGKVKAATPRIDVQCLPAPVLTNGRMKKRKMYNRRSQRQT